MTNIGAQAPKSPAQDPQPHEPPGRRSLWRNRDFMLLWSGQSVSQIGSGITQLAIPLVALVGLNASTLQIGLLTATTTLPYLLVSLPAGAIVDRCAKHKLMMWCDIGRLILLGSIPFVSIPGLGLHLTYLHLMVVALLTGILTVFFDVAYQSYLPILLGREQLVDGNVKLGTTDSFARFVGPSIGSALVGLLGAARAILIDSASYVVSVVSLFLIRTEEPAPEPQVEGRRMRHEIAAGLGFVFKHPILRNVVVCTAMSNFFACMSFALQMLFLIRVLDVRPALVGLVYSASAVGGMVGGMLTGRLSKRIGNARIIWFSIIVMGLPPLMIPLAQPGWGVLVYVLGLFCFMTMTMVYNVAQISYRQAITPPALLGRMNASVRFLVWGTAPLGSALGGVLGSVVGIRPTLAISMVGVWLAGFWVLFSPLRRMRDFEIHEAYRPKDTESAAAAATLG